MKFVISDKDHYEIFANVFQHVKEFNDSFNFNFSKEGLFIQGFDKCHISIFELNLNAEWFSIYEAGTSQLGFNARMFFKILNMRQGGQFMTMSLKDDDDHYMIEFTGGGKKECDKTFKIPLIDVDIEMFTIPKREEDVEFRILHSHFAGIIDQLIQFGENTNIKIDNENITFHTEGTEGEMNAIISTDDLEEFSADECDDGETLINQEYSLKQLKNLCLFSKIGEFISISVSNARPICIAYDVKNRDISMGAQGNGAQGNGAQGNGTQGNGPTVDEVDSLLENMVITEDGNPNYLRLYLAPKIE